MSVLVGLLWSAAAGALTAEGLALAAGAHGQLWSAVGWHALASALAAAAGGCAPAAGGGAKLELRASIAALVWVASLPGVGALGFVLVLLPSWLRANAGEARGVLELALAPERVEVSAAVHSAQPAVDAALRWGSLPERVAAVTSARSLDAATAVGLWRRALRDPSEEVRLLAHALIERQEKALRKRIELALARLLPGASEPLPDGGRQRLLLCVADAHWELVHRQLVQADLARAALESALHYAQAAWSARPSGGGALLSGRACLGLRRAHEARQWLESAERFGIAPCVCVPLQVEAAYVQRDWAGLVAALSRMPAGARRGGTSDPALALWWRTIVGNR